MRTISTAIQDIDTLDREALEAIINHSQVIAFRWRTQPEWVAEYVSRNIERYGYTPEQLLSGNLKFYDLVFQKDVKRVRHELADHLKEGHNEFALEYRMPTQDKEIRWVEQRFWVQRDEQSDTSTTQEVRCLQGIIHDITDRKHSEDTIRYQAYHDSLTGLPNRLLFKDRLAQALAHARRYHSMPAVLFIDLDRFKVINDTLGHAAGDFLLKGVADRLRLLLREEDTVARFGGDEFTILLPEIHNPDDAATVAVKIMRTLYPPFRYKEHDLYVGASIGISLYPRDGKDVDTLLQNADTALYHVKEQGRDAFQFYSPTMYTRTLEKLEMESQLRKALERNELTIHYDPQISLVDMQLLGAEALLFWQHPTRGLLPSSDFMAVAEENGISLQFNQWMLHTACRQASTWHLEGHPRLPLAINLTERMFRQHNLIEYVRDTLAETGLAPRDLVLEVDESLAMRDVAYSISVLRGLKDLGVSLTLDHFGTGYSSLIYLKKFPITQLKLNSAIVRGLQTDVNDESIVVAIISLARRLELTVTAEGVETEEQQRFLCSHACDGMQGSLFSKALPPESFEQLLRFLTL